MADETPTYKVTEDGRVLVALVTAHPLAKVYAERAQAEEIRDYKVGETIFVSREWGNALIDAGQVQIDPTDAKARQEVLLLNRRMAPLTVKELEARGVTGEGADVEDEAGDADAATSAKVEAGAAATPAAAAKPGTKGRTA